MNYGQVCGNGFNEPLSCRPNELNCNTIPGEVPPQLQIIMNELDCNNERFEKLISVISTKVFQMVERYDEKECEPLKPKESTVVDIIQNRIFHQQKYHNQLQVIANALQRLV